MGIVEYAKKFLTLHKSKDEDLDYIFIEDCGSAVEELSGYYLYFPVANKDDLRAQYVPDSGNIAEINKFENLFRQIPHKVVGLLASQNGTTFTAELFKYAGSVDGVLQAFGLGGGTEESTVVEEETVSPDSADSTSLMSDLSLWDIDDSEEEEVFMAPSFVANKSGGPEILAEEMVIAEEDIKTKETTSESDLKEFEETNNVSNVGDERNQTPSESREEVTADSTNIKETEDEQLIGVTEQESSIEEIKLEAKESTEDKSEETQEQNSIEVEEKQLSIESSIPLVGDMVDYNNAEQAVVVADALEAFTRLTEIMPQFRESFMTMSAMIFGDKFVKIMEDDEELNEELYQQVMQAMRNFEADKVKKAYNFAIKRLWHDGDKKTVTRFFNEVMFYFEGVE
jgi:hypothetical protein